MLTPTHILTCAGLLTRRNAPWSNAAAFAGGLAPDVPMFGMFIYDRFIQGLPEGQIWEERYWTDAWQIPTAIGHSIPLALLIFAVGLAAKAPVLKTFALAVLVHVAGDLPFHHDDAHMHLWPLSRWKFISPVSYYEPRYYGNVMHVVEPLLCAAMIALLWRRFEATWVRVASVLALVGTVGVPLYFILMFGGHGPR